MPSSKVARGETAGLRDATGRVRPVISGVRPLVDGGSYPAKASTNDEVTVEADAFTDGPDLLVVEVHFRLAGTSRWDTADLTPLGNDRWRGSFPVNVVGRHEFRIRALIDEFTTWLRALELRAAAGQDLAIELQVGAQLVAAAADRARGADRRNLHAIASRLDASSSENPSAGLSIATESALAALMRANIDSRFASTSPSFPVDAERTKARYSTWYEMFPRSASADLSRPGTFQDVAARLSYVADLGFDVLYLPPIHPIGIAARKGPNGEPQAHPGDPGSPWAIGSEAGGHTAINPDLGSLADFDSLVASAEGLGIEIALDLAFQCSPDHPWVTEHPSWFRHLPDGSIRTAENPPKRYEDVYPLDFATTEWRGLWKALYEIVQFWIGHGVRIFRVDNPHTKPLRFWEWLIATVRSEHPDVIMLAEAFTRPRIMEHLAKVGFSQSYTYFTWRNTAFELRDYLNELTRSPVVDYFRPNLWPNTPDILHESLQQGGRPAFAARLVLAGTLCSNYGIYGPPFELAVRQPRAPGSEEYLDSEKFEIRHWDLDDPASLATLIRSLNAIRRDHRALQSDRSLVFHGSDNEHLLVYSKSAGSRAGDAESRDTVLVAVNLDPFSPQAGNVHLDLGVLGPFRGDTFTVHDLLSGARYSWTGPHNYIRLDPSVSPAHIFVIEDPSTSR